jgi:Flp pilus assembly protein TadG
MRFVPKYTLSEKCFGFLRKQADDERGVTSVEFVIAAVVFMFVLFWTIETGFIMLRWVMLERGVDIAARELRIFGLPASLQDGNGDVSNDAAHTYVKGLICANTAIIKDCDNVLTLELISSSSNDALSNTDVQCVDRTDTVNPVVTPNVDVGARNVANSRDIMYMRSCVVVDPILPANYAMPLPKDSSGGVALIVDSAYVNEP